MSVALRADGGTLSASRSSPSRRGRWTANLAITVASLVLLFAAAELVSTLFLPAPVVWRYPQEAYVYDPQLLHRLKPNQSAFTHSFPVSTNSYGLRNEE